MNEPPDPLIGTIVDGRWRVTERLGQGGMGTVYGGERIKLGKRVALKFLDERCARSKDAMARFDREARAISRLQHAHCVSIVDFGVHDGRPFIVMEYVAGKPLGRVMGKKEMTPERAVNILRQMLDALRHAHSHGVVHRDLKPENVMLAEVTGTEDYVKILDFGLARIISVDEPTISMPALVAGTPSWMSPEQAAGHKVDHRSDIFTAGVMLYGMCTGRKPFRSDDTAELLRQVREMAPTPPRKLQPGLSEALEKVILKAMAKSPDARFYTASEFLVALERTPEAKALRRPSSPTRRRARPVLALALLGLVGGGAYLLREPIAHFVERRAHHSLATAPTEPSSPSVNAATAKPAVATSAPPAEAKPAAPPTEATPAPAATGSTPPANDKATASPSSAIAAEPKPGAPPSQAPAAETKPEETETKPAATETKPSTTEAKTSPPEAKPSTTEAKPSTTEAKTSTTEAKASTTEAKPSPPETKVPVAETKPNAADATSAPKRAPSSPRAEIAALVDAGKLAAAEQALRAAAHDEPRAAWVHLQLGEIYFRRLWRDDAIKQWEEALRLDPELRHDHSLGDHLCTALGPKWHGAGAHLLDARFADELIPTLERCLAAVDDYPRLQLAAHLLERAAGRSHVDAGLIALRTLELAPACDDRRAAVRTLVRLHDSRAASALERLRADSCLAPVLSTALDRLR